MAVFKIPSIDFLFQEVLRTFRRFPMAMFSSVLLTVCGFALVVMAENHKKYEPAIRVLMKFEVLGALGISLFTAAHLFAERQVLPTARKASLFAVLVALLGVYYFCLPDEPSIMDTSRYLILFAASHLLVSVAAYQGRQEDNGFWGFNILVFGRALFTGLYCFVVTLALMSALGAVDVLFSLRLSWKIYTNIAILINCFGSAVLFLSGVPQNYEELEETPVQIEPLRLLTQYLIVPIVSIYGAILYAYGLMILFTWNLPKGLVILLMMGFCIASMLGILLVYPIRHQQESKWVSVFSRIFYRAILPLMLLYFVAIGKRVAQYGITPDRYFVMVAGIWLVCVAVYFIISKQKRIFYIPLTLAFVGIASVVGPWSAYSVSAYSQAARFGAILLRNKALTAGKIDLKRLRENPLSEKDATELREIIEFLARQSHTGNLQSYFRDDLTEEKREKPSEEKARLLALLGDSWAMNQTKKQQFDEPRMFGNFMPKKWRKIDGYQYIVSLDFEDRQYLFSRSKPDEVEIDKTKYSFSLDFKECKLYIEQKGRPLATVNIQPLIDNLVQKTDNEAQAGELEVLAESARYKVLLHLNRLETAKEVSKNKYNRIVSLTGSLLFKIIE